MGLLVEQVRPKAAVRSVSDSDAVSVSPKLPEARWLAGFVFLLNMAVGIYLAYGIHYIDQDALSRVADAYYVFFSRQPHLAAIGFVWNPLPSLLVLPLVLLKPLFPAIVTRGLAGSFLTALFGALGAAQLTGVLASLGISRPWRIAAVLLYAINPLIVLYGANGMTDLMLMTTYLGALNGVLSYARNRSLKALVAAGLWMAVGFGVRYEAVPFALFLAFGLVAALWGKRPLREIESAVILLLTPITYAGAVWMYFNWLIMKNPLYFMNSPYGNAAQTGVGAGIDQAVIAARHHLVGTLLYAGHFTFLFWPVVVGVAGTIFWLYGRRKDPRATIVLAAAVGALSLNVAMVYLGMLDQWDRFFISYIPMGFVLVSFVASKLAAGMPPRKRWVMAGMLIVLLSGNIGTWKALGVPVLSHSDGVVLHDAVTMTAARSLGIGPVVAYINAHPHLLILADTFTAYGVVLQAKHPGQFVITSDTNFESVLHNPLGQVSAFLVPEPTGVAKLDAINRAYPRLWSGQVRWTYLIASFKGQAKFRLYGIRADAP